MPGGEDRKDTKREGNDKEEGVGEGKIPALIFCSLSALLLYLELVYPLISLSHFSDKAIG